MSEILFYHLDHGGPEAALVTLAEKTLARGQRALVIAGSREAADRLDETLWTYDDASFLPHGRSQEAGPQPLLILTEDEARAEADAHEGREVLFLIDGASADLERIAGFDRAALIFDGRDEEAVEAARAFWRDAKANGVGATYWRRNRDGGWEKAG